MQEKSLGFRLKDGRNDKKENVMPECSNKALG